MDKQIEMKEYIEGILKSSRFAVLVKEGYIQPHAKLIAITPFVNCRQLIHATCKNTRKYRNHEQFRGKVVLDEMSY